MTRDVIRVLLADDHETVREGLKLLIDGQPDMRVVGEAGNGRLALDGAIALKPTVVVLDVSMPEMNGLAATREIRRGAPGAAVVALTRYRDEAYVKELLSAGALGYVLKQSPSGELLTAIRAAAAGKRHLDPGLSGHAAGSLINPRHPSAPPPRVTDREREVLRMMARGHSNKEIAAAMDISVKTVEVHKANAMRKLDLNGRIDVMKFAMLQGWLQDA
jgi:DNA-binding NarL/FixJ family response regulator